MEWMSMKWTYFCIIFVPWYSQICFPLLHFIVQDILFGLVRKLFHSHRKSSDSKEKPPRVPKIIIMSATLNHDKFSEFLGGCPVFEIPGRCYPVKNTFLDYVGVKDLQTPNYLKRVRFECICIDILYSI